MSEIEALEDRLHHLLASDEHYDYGKVCEQAASDVGQEKRQEFLDHLWSGMTLGDAREAAGISFDAALGTVNMNTETKLELRRVSL